MYLWDVILYMDMDIALFKNKLSSLSPSLAILLITHIDCYTATPEKMSSWP